MTKASKESYLVTLLQEYSINNSDSLESLIHTIWNLRWFGLNLYQEFETFKTNIKPGTRIKKTENKNSTLALEPNISPVKLQTSSQSQIHSIATSHTASGVQSQGNSNNEETDEEAEKRPFIYPAE